MNFKVEKERGFKISVKDYDNENLVFVSNY